MSSMNGNPPRRTKFNKNEIHSKNLSVLFEVAAVEAIAWVNTVFGICFFNGAVRVFFRASSLTITVSSSGSGLISSGEVKLRLSDSRFGARAVMSQVKA